MVLMDRTERKPTNNEEREREREKGSSFVVERRGDEKDASVVGRRRLPTNYGAFGAGRAGVGAGRWGDGGCSSSPRAASRTRRRAPAGSARSAARSRAGRRVCWV